MRYPIAIETGDSKHAYGVVVPDLPGCFSAIEQLRSKRSYRGWTWAIVDVDVSLANQVPRRRTRVWNRPSQWQWDIA